jgi:hypothetical protein
MLLKVHVVYLAYVCHISMLTLFLMKCLEFNIQEQLANYTINNIAEQMHNVSHKTQQLTNLTYL